MFKQVVLPILAVVAFIVLVGLFVQKAPSLDFSSLLDPKSSTSSQKTIKIEEKELKVEVADTESARQKGLSGRNSLDDNSGMLFVFDPADSNPIFWMKDMLISIDIIWINDGKIIKINKNVEAPKERTPDSKLMTYSPGQPIDYVLEVGAGYSEKNNISVGNSVDLSGI